MYVCMYLSLSLSPYLSLSFSLSLYIYIYICKHFPQGSTLSKSASCRNEGRRALRQRSHADLMGIFRGPLFRAPLIISLYGRTIPESRSRTKDVSTSHSRPLGTTCEFKICPDSRLTFPES